MTSEARPRLLSATPGPITRSSWTVMVWSSFAEMGVSAWATTRMF